MTAELIAFEAVVDEDGHLRVPEDAAARLRAQLGHEPQPGEKVPVTVGLTYEQAVENWLRTDVVRTVAEMRAHPEDNLTADQVRVNLAARHAERQAVDAIIEFCEGLADFP